jgi:tetratricopeptide (TPR) repeat protein
MPADLVDETDVSARPPRPIPAPPVRVERTVEPEAEADAGAPESEEQVIRVEDGVDGDDLGWAEDEPWQPEEWIDEGLVRNEAEGAVERGRRRAPRRDNKPPRASAGPDQSRWSPMAGAEDDEVDEARRGEERKQQVRDATTLDDELRAAVGAGRVERFEKRMKDGGEAFKRGRYDEARRTLRPLVETAPRVAALRELYGLTLYRLERWKAAANELETFRTLTGSVEQHPVLADCYRALGRHSDVEELWLELSAASPSAALVAEGRIVAAGDLADQGRIDEAIKLLEPGVRPARRAKDHHLRVAYALADLYERAGDLPRARELFVRVASNDPDFIDVRARLAGLD